MNASRLRCPQGIPAGRGHSQEHGHRRAQTRRLHERRRRQALDRTKPRQNIDSPESHITRMTTAVMRYGSFRLHRAEDKAGPASSRLAGRSGLLTRSSAAASLPVLRRCASCAPGRLAIEEQRPPVMWPGRTARVACRCRSTVACQLEICADRAEDAAIVVLKALVRDDMPIDGQDVRPIERYTSHIA
jgi:hypothetical protein